MAPTATKVELKPTRRSRRRRARRAGARQSAGGVILPDTAKEKPQEGIILAVGPGRETDKGEIIPMDVKVGDRVLYSKYSGSEIKIDGTEYLIIREKDVLAIVDKVPAASKELRKHIMAAKQLVFDEKRASRARARCEHPRRRGQGDARARRAATSCSTRNSARRRSPTTA